MSLLLFLTWQRGQTEVMNPYSTILRIKSPPSFCPFQNPSSQHNLVQSAQFPVSWETQQRLLLLKNDSLWSFSQNCLPVPPFSQCQCLMRQLNYLLRTSKIKQKYQLIGFQRCLLVSWDMVCSTLERINQSEIDEGVVRSGLQIQNHLQSLLGWYLQHSNLQEQVFPFNLIFFFC